jgi:hypothetical protein
MDNFDNLVGKRSADSNTDGHNDPISGDDKESQEDLGTPKNNSSENEGSLQRNSSGGNKNKKSKKVKGQDIIDELKKNIRELFVDQIGDAYAAVEIKDYIEAIPINSGRFREWIIKTCYNYGRQVQSDDSENERSIPILSDEQTAKYQTIIKLEAEEHCNERRLEVRVAGSVDSDDHANEDGNVIYYDLCNKDGEIIKVTKNGWETIKHGCLAEKDSSHTIVFKHYRNQLPQVIPSKDYPANIFTQFLDLTNLPSDDIDNRILAEVYITSLFLPPDIAKPILLPHGEQGSAKSTFQEFIKDLVDPSGALTLAFPTSLAEMIQQLSHNYVVYYDNVSSLPQWISDVLCRAVTGSGFSKRMLYTDDDDLIYQFKRCVGFNGINIAATKPDVLERALILHLKRIPDNKRRKLAQLWKRYKMIKPQLLGFIFDLLVQVLKRLKEVQLNELPRMADWAEIGEVISRCLEHPEGTFIQAYKKNLAKQNEHALEASPVATVMIRLMEKRMSEGSSLAECLDGLHYFEGSMTDLLIDLKKIAEDELGIDTNDKFKWPRSPQALGNKLNEAATNLREIGIVIEQPENKASHTKNIILIKQNASDGKPGNSLLESFPTSSPLENDQIHAQFEHQTGNGKLGDFPLSVEEKNDNEIGSSCTLEVPASSPTSPVSRSNKNHAQIASDTDGKLDGEVGACASSCSPLHNASLSNTNSGATKVISITDFFYDDPTMPYLALPDHKLDQSPCFPIIAMKDGYYYCRLHPEIKNTYLESIEHHIKYNDPAAHKSELLRSPKLTHN